ncbi:T9SS type A sorting domain-containing protein [Pontibacter arcticus]|uniref:Por secretion system C-terminal sorting domain-containing protein n=1 Tax=Pontibacter arcticus TaxID=2080288 RepID=A0A364RB17_9BACT|nr:T9SS type A sorting domain-containing protein [Pontibacter arcticus]RAU81474.1 hypothetical protein DP923_15290 [Pontibacter arcticus]
MRTSTYLMLFIAFILIIAQPAKAQYTPPDEIETADCEYNNPCFTAIYDEFLINADSTMLTIVMSIIPITDGDCSDTEQIAISALGGEAQTFTLAELNDNPIVTLVVDREAFQAFPQVGLVTLDSIVLAAGLDPVLLPTRAIALNARIGTDNPCQEIVPLPVELISFEGKASAAGIALEWSTASEKDNSHFEVERSADGQAFEQIGKVNGNGNSSVKRRYNFTDNNPASDLNYYRLKQVDFDGKSEYSKVITVTADVLASSELSINLAPNPCENGDCSAIIANPGRQGAITLELKDMSGRLVHTKTITETSGSTVKIPMAELAPHKGLFILTATSGTNVVHKRVVLR